MGFEYANAALDELAVCVQGRSAVDRLSAEGAERGAISLGGDALQGLAEIIQNADDQGARRVSITLRTGEDHQPELLVVHDGRPIELDHVVAMAFPWITTKRDDASATGRFGIGLKTLNSLGGPLRVHCAPYHVELNRQTVVPLSPASPIPTFYNPARRHTLVCLPLKVPLGPGDLTNWLDGVGPSGLVFMRSVRTVRLLDEAGKQIVVLAVRVVGEAEVVTLTLGGRSIAASVHHLVDSERVRWERYATEVAVPEDMHRQAKANSARTLVQVALPSTPTLCRIHAALPVEVTGLPFAVNGQFDPETGRQHLLATEWNHWLLAETAVLSAAIAAHGLENGSPLAWSAVPLGGDLTHTASPVLATALLDNLVGPVRAALTANAIVPGGAPGFASLGELDYEEAALEGLVGEEEVRLLVGVEAVPLTSGQRDERQRWRSVLAEFGVPPVVTTARALGLYAIADLDWKAAKYALLTERALEDPVGKAQIAGAPCVVLADGIRRAPVARDSGTVLVEELDETSLAARLRLAMAVHPDYIAASAPVIEWLRTRGSLVRRHDSPAALVSSLARPGDTVELRPADLRELRDAFEGLAEEQRRQLGPQVGRRITVPCRHAVDGRWQAEWAPPARAYLPASIDKVRDSWARAAGKTPGLLWLAPEVDGALKGAGREVSGSIRFLKLLGAANGPRLHEPQGTARHFRRSEERVTPITSARPATQREQLFSAPQVPVTHLRGDRSSDDLATVCRSIASGRRSERVARARALLATLSRGWGEYLEHTTAEAVLAYDGYYSPCRTVIASWLADLQEVAWVPTGRGTARRPQDTAVRTPATELVYGRDPASFVAAGVAEGLRPDTLRAVGVRLDPSASTLIQQLAGLCAEEAKTTTPPETVAEDCRAIYRLLAEHTRRTGPGGSAGRVDDLTLAELRRLFTAGTGLVRTNLGWRQPAAVLRGRPIFGRHRAWAPGGTDTLPLWTALQVREAQAGDCIAVLQELARGRSLRADDEGILLEAFEHLADLADALNDDEKLELRRLPLWSGTRWLRTRPVALLDDSALADALPDGMAVWRPPLPLLRLRPLLEALRVHSIDTATLESPTVGPVAQVLGEPLRPRYALACQHLAAELPRTDVALAKSARVDLTQLALAPVLVVPGLTVAVPHPAGPLDIPVRAHVRLEPLAWLVADERAGGADDGAARAVARLFDGDRQKVAWAWSAMWQKAGNSVGAAQPPALSRAPDDDPDPLEALVSSAPDRSKARAARATTDHPPTAPVLDAPPVTEPASKTPRRLKDAATLVIDKASLLKPGQAPAGVSVPKRRGLRDLSHPLPKPSQPARAALPGVDYTDDQRQQLALAALRQLLDAGPEDLVDVTALRGIGADALDRTNRPFELKPAGREMPDHVTLTANEAERASTTPGFCLVVVAGLEEGQHTEIVVVVDPLHSLPLHFGGDVTVGDLRARSRPLASESPTVST